MAPLNQQLINPVQKERRKCAPTQLKKLGGQWMTHGPDCCRESRPPLPPSPPPPPPPIHHILALYHRVSGPPVPSFLTPLFLPLFVFMGLLFLFLLFLLPFSMSLPLSLFENPPNCPPEHRNISTINQINQPRRLQSG